MFTVLSNDLPPLYQVRRKVFGDNDDMRLETFRDKASVLNK